MSALADSGRATGSAWVRVVPFPVVSSAAIARLFDRLVGGSEQRRRHFEAERLRSLEVDYQLVLGRLLDRQLSHLCAPENPIGVRCSTPVTIGYECPIRHKATIDGEETVWIHRGQPVLCCRGNDRFAMLDRNRAWKYDCRAIWLACNCSDALLDFRGITHAGWRQLYSERWRGSLDRAQISGP